MVLSFVLNVRIITLVTLFGSLLQPAFKKSFIFLLAIVTETPECRIDRDCPSKLACISESCQNPCKVNNPCSNSQKCVVIDSQPSKSVACVCPEGAVFGSNGQCTQGIIFGLHVTIYLYIFCPLKLDAWCSLYFNAVQVRPQCVVNEDCQNPDICQLGNCIDACRATSCGINAVCTSASHRAECKCLQGYRGDPFTACSPCKRWPFKLNTL